jgi:hypothetical protein
MSGGDGWVGTVIDVSKWQSSLPDLSGVLGVIARAGIGTKPDTMFASHIANARKAGKWVGAYWYNWGDLSVSDQVNAFIAREQEVGGVQLHVLDWEGAEGFTAAQAADFMRIYKARTGDPIVLYASEGRYRDLGQDANWIANYSNEPSKSYDMWQYGSFRGVDGNHARQRILDLVQENTQMAQLAVTNRTEVNIVIAKGAIRRNLDGRADGYVFDAEYTRFSPYGAGPYRAFFVTVNGQAEVRLVTAKSTSGIIDLTQYGSTDVTKAASDARAAQLAADQAAIESANAARDAAVADLTTATADERERIALGLAAEEADRVRSLGGQ